MKGELLTVEKHVCGKNLSWPKISVVTPSYNQAEFLERTILSVLGQKYPNLEYIIVDGGSTDGSVEIIKKYEKYFAYWCSEQDKGQSDAINKGFAKSTGVMLAWINSDDIYLPGAFFAAARAFMKEPEMVMLYGDWLKIDADDCCLAIRRAPSFDYKICVFTYLTVCQPASFFKRKAFFDVGGLDVNLNYSMDFDLIEKLARHGKVIQIKECLAAFRLHPSSKSVASQSGFRDESLKIRRKSIGRSVFPGELFFLYWYHRIRVFSRMMVEGYFLSRVIKRKGKYRVNGCYSPEKLYF